MTTMNDIQKARDDLAGLNSQPWLTIADSQAAHLAWIIEHSETINRVLDAALAEGDEEDRVEKIAEAALVRAMEKVLNTPNAPPDFLNIGDKPLKSPASTGTVDLESLKRGKAYKLCEHTRGYEEGWNDCLDHIASRCTITNKGEA